MRTASSPGLRATLAVAVAYALANAGIRLVGGTHLAMDDAKTNLFTQVWRWGYQADNPPLYEWLIKSLRLVTGGGLGSFLILNALCLVAAAGFVHAAMRPFAGQRAAFGTACGMVLLYQVGWNFHQAFTHSALLLAATAAGMWAGLRLVRAPTPSSFLIFGVALGLGLMAKYNFALFALGFFGAAMTTAAGRRAVLSPWMLMSLVLATLIIAPHAAWLAGRADVYAASLPDTLGLEGSRLARMGAGVVSLLIAVVSFFLPWALVHGWLRRRASAAPGAWEASLLLQTGVFAVATILLGILAFGIGAVSERYVIPALLPAYAGLTGMLLARHPRASRPYLFASLAVASLFTAVRLAGFAMPGPPLCEDCRVFTPYEVLNARLAEIVPSDAILLAREENTAGNLVAAFPDARVTSLNLLTQFNPATPSDAGRPCYYVWSEDTVGGVPLFDVFRFAYDDPRTEIVAAQWPERGAIGDRITTWGVTPLTGDLYDRFCAANAPG